MTLRSIFNSSIKSITATGKNSELLKAQHRAFSRQMPLMYFILLSNTWAAAATHLASAPLWLTIGLPTLLTLLSAVRVLHWWKSRNDSATPEVAQAALQRVKHVAFWISIVLVAWSAMLFPYGDAYARSHLAFYMAITLISCIFSVMHVRAAALIVTAIANCGFIIIFAMSGEPTFLAAAITIALVSAGMLVILTINQQDFARMVNAQTEALRKHEQQSRLLRMLDDMPVAVMTVDLETLNIAYVNKTSKELIQKIEHLLPIKAADLLGTSIDVFHKHPEHQRRILADPKNLPHNAIIKLGPEVLDLKVSAVMADDGSYIGPMLTWEIVTKVVEAENRIRQLAHYDSLTGLPNRVTFYEELTKGLSAPDSRMCLLYVDLDGFKLINDTRGHLVGDIMLRQVANRLSAICDEPAKMVGRLGGDEFAILIENGDVKSATELSYRIIEALSRPYDFDYDKSIQLGASIGFAIAPEHGDDADTLLGRADLALYEAKAGGKRQLRIFASEMEFRVQERLRLEAMLRNTLESRDGLFVFYQPIVNAKTGEVTAREALVRWHHTERGWISPANFIPLAEQSDLIDQLGEFVLEQACRDAVERGDGLRVAVNISASQLGKGTIAPAVRSALNRSQLSPDQLEIEVTETAIVTAGEAVIDDLRALRDMGLRVALDDFGTGYSSLSHLNMFPFDKIKIDGSFVKEAVGRPESAAIVRAVADLGKRLGVTTVAEGVETQEQLDCVREEGCTEIQGYLFGRPEPNDRDAPIIARLNQDERNIARRRTEAAVGSVSERL